MIKELHKKLIEKHVTSRQLTEEAFVRIEKNKLNSFITLTPEMAFKQADDVDKDIASGKEIDLLAGIPMSVKDVFMVKDVRATGGSKMLENYIAPYTATAIQKLFDNGAVCLGKTNCDEFAMGSTTENSAFGPTLNPWDHERVPGGTSGGSAAAVAALEGFYSIGSDTGGSVRQPAAFCGVIGFKPTYGAISRYGLIATASSLDTVGILAQSVEDAEYIFKVMKGKDSLDSTSEDFSFEKLPIKKIGIIQEYFPKKYSSKEVFINFDFIKSQITKFKNLLKCGKDNENVIEISLPSLNHALASYYIINYAEISSNLARLDGMRYGENHLEVENLLHQYLSNRSLFGAEAKRRIMLGTHILSAGYYGAYYKKAQSVREMIVKDFKKAFEKVDILVGPVTVTTAYKFGEKAANPLEMYLGDIYTVAANLAKVPAMSVPIGFNFETGMPIGIQLIGKWGQGKALLDFAKHI